MDREEMLNSLAHLPDDASVTLTFEVGEVRRTLRQAEAGPGMVTTTWCASELGFSARQWRQWCEAEVVAGARKDASGRWRLPNTAAREQFERALQEGHAHPPPKGKAARPVDDPHVTPLRSRRPGRGPWKKEAVAGGKS